jgi:hypothetical protein
MARKRTEIKGIRHFAPAEGGWRRMVGVARQLGHAAFAVAAERVATVWAIFTRLAVTIPQPT